MGLLDQVRAFPGRANLSSSPSVPARHTIESVLDQLALYGSPRLFKMDKGWHCAISMCVSGKGISFDVCSGFNHPSALDAALCCFDRMNSALKGFGK